MPVGLVIFYSLESEKTNEPFNSVFLNNPGIIGIFSDDLPACKVITKNSNF